MAEVAIIGAGAVGTASAGAVLQSGIASRLRIYDRDGDRARGEALDFKHAAPLLPECEIDGGSLAELEPADVAIVAAGARPRSGHSRLEVLDANLEVAAAVAEAVAPAPPRVAIVVSNPVDALTECFRRAWAPLGVNVFGTGTALDSWRLRELLAARLGVHPANVHAWVIGEHGLSAVFPFSCARVGPFRLDDFAARRGVALDTAVIADQVRKAGPRVHELKGSTSSAIALTAARLAEHVLREGGYLSPVSVPVEDGLCASLPAPLGAAGAGEPLDLVLDAAERSAWEASLAVLRDAAARIP